MSPDDQQDPWNDDFLNRLVHDFLFRDDDQEDPTRDALDDDQDSLHGPVAGGAPRSGAALNASSVDTSLSDLIAEFPSWNDLSPEEQRAVLNFIKKVGKTVALGIGIAAIVAIIAANLPDEPSRRRTPVRPAVQVRSSETSSNEVTGWVTIGVVALVTLGLFALFL